MLSVKWNHDTIQFTDHLKAYNSVLIYFIRFLKSKKF